MREAIKQRGAMIIDRTQETGKTTDPALPGNRSGLIMST
ncbi:hypothetical protein L345_01488 [Ophiophagus hannah]|uniref:Uncharacterized protein n=1 Tax=Ophiophagus hannah TaxID=8665 RepID=V8PFA5_OPHHA|nr:hypothetical protein L345_01488 [Ophiophagus hannah]